MISLDLFTSRIHLEAPGAPSSLVEQELLAVAIELCRESLVWNQPIPAITTLDAQADYSVTEPADSKVALVYSLALNGSPIRPTFESPGSFTLSSVPQAGSTITGRMALVPAWSATEVADLLYDLYQDALVSGALSRLLIQPNQPWSNPSLVEFHRERFREGVFDAKIKAMKQFGSYDNLNNTHPESLGVVA